MEPKRSVFDWALCCWRGVDCIPPNKSALDWVCWVCGCGAAAGFDAYKDKIDDFKSALPGTPGVDGPVLEGLAGAAADDPPKKSSPSKLSPGFVCFGGAGVAFGVLTGSVVLGLAGAASIESPNKSTSCGLTALEEVGGAIPPMPPFL